MPGAAEKMPSGQDLNQEKAPMMQIQINVFSQGGESLESLGSSREVPSLLEKIYSLVDDLAAEAYLAKED